MKLSSALLAVALAGSTAAFTVGPAARSSVITSTSSVTASSTRLYEKMAVELGTPCEDECALDSYPKMPDSVHPGVNTGQSMVDLLNHAKENGKLMGR